MYWSSWATGTDKMWTYCWKSRHCSNGTDRNEGCRNCCHAANTDRAGFCIYWRNIKRSAVNIGPYPSITLTKGYCEFSAPVARMVSVVRTNLFGWWFCQECTSGAVCRHSYLNINTVSSGRENNKHFPSHVECIMLQYKQTWVKCNSTGETVLNIQLL